MENNPNRFIFRHTMEPNEGAFSILVPEGWQIEGGIPNSS